MSATKKEINAALRKRAQAIRAKYPSVNGDVTTSIESGEKELGLTYQNRNGVRIQLTYPGSFSECNIADLSRNFTAAQVLKGLKSLEACVRLKHEDNVAREQKEQDRDQEFMSGLLEGLLELSAGTDA